MDSARQLDDLRTQIAQIVGQRDRLKQAIAEGEIAPTKGFRELEALDERLSTLDSRFKKLWDASGQTGITWPTRN